MLPFAAPQFPPLSIGLLYSVSEGQTYCVKPRWLNYFVSDESNIVSINADTHLKIQICIKTGLSNLLKKHSKGHGNIMMSYHTQ